MPTPQRRHQPGLMRQLIEQPQRFQFFQAVRLIKLWLRRGAPAHETLGQPGQRAPTLDRVLRFRNSVSLAFPASQIEALSVEGDEALSIGADKALSIGGDAADALPRRIHLTPAFMGMLGVHGLLPYDYTETIAAQIRYDKNEGGRAFFDTFSQRSMMLFYRAWENSRVEYRVGADGGDGFLALQLALAGRHPCRPNGAPFKPADAIIADEVAARYAALIRHRPLSSDVIAAVLTEYFGLPFRLEGFVGAWETQPPQEQTQLGVLNCQLGVDSLAGPRYWRRDLCARLWIGPLSRADFDRFLPLGSGGKALKAVLALFAVATVRFDVRLILQAAQIAPAALDGSAPLGHGAFLLSGPAPADRHVSLYHIQF